MMSSGEVQMNQLTAFFGPEGLMWNVVNRSPSELVIEFLPKKLNVKD
jgi:hypothetical protein